MSKPLPAPAPPRSIPTRAPSLSRHHSRLGSIQMEMDQPRQPIVSRLDLSVFEMVRKGLADTSTVGWDNAHVSIELATKVYNRPEAKRFLHQFLHQITGIMLDQVFR